MLLSMWEPVLRLFANSSNKRVILEHPAQVRCLCGFWHLPVKAQVMGDFGDNSACPTECYMHEWGWGVGKGGGGGLRAKLVSWWT